MAVESLQSSPSLSEKEMERFTELVLKHPEALGLFPSVTSNGDVYEPLEYLDLTSLTHLADLSEHSASERLNRSSFASSLKETLLEHYFAVSPNPISSLVYPSFLKSYREIGFSGVLSPTVTSECGATGQKILDVEEDVQRECFEIIVMALVVLGARASPHSAILGTDVSNCPLKRRNRPDFRKLGSSREPFCQQLSKHLMNSASSSSAFSLSRSGLFGIIALTEAVMSLCPWIQNESEAQIVRGYLSTAIENFKELWKRGDAEGLVHSLGARIWCIDIDLALQVNKQPFLGHEDILSIFSLSDCPPEYLLSCQALLQSDPEQHFRDGLPSPFGPKCRNKVLPLSLYALRRTTLLAILSVPSLTFSSLLQLVQALFVLQAQHAKWFLAHREYIFRKTTLPLSPRSAASHTRMFILQELENIALVFAAQWICDEAKKLWGCVDEYRDDLNAIGRIAEKMTQESVDRGLMLLRRGLTVEAFEELYGPKGMFMWRAHRVFEKLPGGAEWFYDYFKRAEGETEQIKRLNDIESLLDFASPAAWFGASYIGWVRLFEDVLDRCYMGFDPTTVEGTRLKAEFIAKTWLPPIIEPSTCITPLFASTRPITENNGSSSIIHNSHDRESKTQERTTRSALDREEDEDDLEPSRKRRRRTCRRCRKPSCRGHKDIALCLEKPRIPCARCGGLESCPRGADEGRECSNADGGSSEPQAKQARIETKSQPRKRDVNAEKERRKSRTCRRCRKDTCKGYIDISLCPETPKVACIKCHRLDCLGGADGGRHCQN